MGDRTSRNVEAFPDAYVDFSMALKHGVPFTAFDFHGTRADVFRFANRFRVASAFTRIDLDGYTTPTVDGYSALFRVFLVWSALEQWLKVTRIDKEDAEALLPRNKAVKAVRAIRKADKENRFFNGVSQRCTNSKVRSALKEYLNGESDALLPLVMGVRHAFAHGDLAPGSNSASPGVAKKVASMVCPLILGTLDDEFTKWIAAGLAGRAGSRE